MSASTIAQHRPRRLSRPASFTAVAVLAVLFPAASSAPSPLYVVYQQEWHFSAATLTLIFAVYVIGLVLALLMVGALSDHIGRRPVLAGAIALEAVSLVLFAAAGNIALLFLARILQGVATGAAITALSATLVDLNPPHAPGRAGLVNGIAPTGGLAIGALGCGLLVQYAPAPTRLVYIVLVVSMVLAALAVAAMPETSARRPGGLASLQPRLGVPARVRTDFWALLPVLIATWALGGLYLSLGPSVAAGIFALTNHLIGGLVVAVMCGSSAVTAVMLRKSPAQRVLDAGAVLLAIGSAITLASVASDAVALAIVGTVVAGVGFGASVLGSFGAVVRMCGPAERGELFAVAYTIAYLSLSIPAVIAGFAATSVGLRTTAIWYTVGLIVLCGITLVAQRLLMSRRQMIHSWCGCGAGDFRRAKRLRGFGKRSPGNGLTGTVKMLKTRPFPLREENVQYERSRCIGLPDCEASHEHVQSSLAAAVDLAHGGHIVGDAPLPGGHDPDQSSRRSGSV